MNRWHDASLPARRVIERMRKQTPPGAAPPWRTVANVRPIQALLDDGVTYEDLVDLVDGAAELVERGRQKAKWYYPSNLFGRATCERWIADIAAWRQIQAEAEARQAELAALEEPTREPAPSSSTVDLQLHRIGLEGLRAIREREQPEEGSEDEGSVVGS